MSSIFIQIPSYRDFELNKTIASAVNNASGENKLHFGIHQCLLFDSEIVINTNYPDWVKIDFVDSIAPENIGLQKARYIANEFYNDEDYYFQIDAHMRFVKNWDLKGIKMINEFVNLGIKKPLITSYPPAYWYLDDGLSEHYSDYYPTKILFSQDTEQFKTTLLPLNTAYPTDKYCAYTYGVSGGCIFTLGSFAQIKPNVKIAFWGEEPLIAARAFTHGFNLVTSPEHLISHLYVSDQPFNKIRRHHVWNDFPKIWNQMDVISKQEYRSIFTDRRIGDDGFGTVRTLGEYEEFAGLNFATGEVRESTWIK